MSSAYGNQVQKWRAYVNAYVISETQTTATVRTDCYWTNVSNWGYDTACVGYATTNGQTVNTPTTAGSRKTAYAAAGSSVQEWLISKDVTVNKGTSGYNVACSARVDLVGGYHNGSSTASVNVWVNAISYSAPAAPSKLTVTRVSDTQQKLAWTNGTGTTVAPVSGVNVNKLVDGTGSWSYAYSGSLISSYTDGGTTAGHKYTYDIRNTGAGGTSAASNQVTVYTSPTAPTGVTVAKTDSGVLVSIGTYPKWYDAVSLERSTDSGTTWESVSYTKSDDGYLDPKPPAGVVCYRIGCSIGGIAGAWTATDDVVTICPPNAPTLTKLADVYPTESNITVQWTPNHPDWTAQGAAQVEVVIDGASTVYDLDGATAYMTIERAANGSYQVRVRTKGTDPDWGAWSAYTVFRVVTPPSLSITSPKTGATIAQLPMSVAWSADDDTNIIAQSITVTYRDGSSFYTADLTASERSIELGSALGFRNSTKYSLSITVTAGSGLTATASCDFSTEWTQPDAPDVDVSVNDSMAAVVTITAADSEPVAKSFDLVRVVDGERKVLATGVSSGAQVLDRLPPLNSQFTYEVTAYAESGSLLVLNRNTTLQSDRVALNFGADAATSWTGHLDPDWSRDVSHDVETYHFFNGSELPSAWPTGEMDISESYSFSVAETDYLALKSIAATRYEGWLRDLYGSRSFGVLSFSSSRKSYGWWKVSVKLTQCAWEEPTDA